MKRAIPIAWGLVAALAGVSLAQDDKIELFSDQGMSSCELSYNGFEFRSVYMFHTGTQGAWGAQFKAPKPACWTGATWISDALVSPFISIGTSQTDLAISYGGCLQPPVYLGTINYVVTSASANCCPYPVLPAPTSPAPGEIVVYDCDLINLRRATAGSQVMINPTADCPNCEIPPPPPPPSVDKIELFADQGMSTCELSYTAGVLLRSVYMFHTGPDAATGSQFMAPKPTCWTDATWISDNIPFIYLGSTQSDITIGYSSCLQPPIYLGSINYLVTGPGSSCCPYPVLPAPTSPIPGSIAFSDCSPFFDLHPADAGQKVMINPNASCPNCELGPVAVQETTWGRVKALYRN